MDPLRRRASRALNVKFQMEESEMPNIKSAKKRVKVIEKKTLQNKMFKSSMKT